jgi:hypothetical protein
MAMRIGKNFGKSTILLDKQKYAELPVKIIFRIDHVITVFKR